jgi:hypothetical protein
MRAASTDLSDGSTQDDGTRGETSAPSIFSPRTPTNRNNSVTNSADVFS